eukprot:375732_1
MSNKTQKKRIHTSRNALVDIDSVSVQPGANYNNWIKLTKQQLKEREFILFSLKINKIQSIVNHRHFIIHQQIIDTTMNMLCNKIDQWKGVNINRTKVSSFIYSDYYIISTKWWDNRKRIIYGNNFWLSIFQCIEQFINNDFRLLLKIINILFNSTFQCPNTKPCSLISVSTLIYSEQLHIYLYNKHHSLDIKKWIKTSKCRHKPKIIITKLKNALKVILIAETQTQIIQNRRNTNLNINIINQNNNVTLNNPIISQYIGLHHATFSVSDKRYTPLLSLPSYSKFSIVFICK